MAQSARPGTARPARHTSNALLAAGVALMLAIGGIATLVIALLRQDALEYAHNHLDAVAELHARHAARAIQAVDLALEAAAERAETLGLSDAARRREMHGILRKRASEAPQIRALLIIDAQGRAIVDSAAEPPRRLQVDDRDYFLAQRDHADGGLFIGSPVRSRLNNLWLIGMSRRIEASDGRFAGVALASVVPEYFEDFFAALPADNGYWAVLLREDGRLLARHPPATGELGDSWTWGDAKGGNAEDAAEGIPPQSASPFAGEPHLKAFRRLPDYPLLVVVAATERSVLAVWRQRASIVLLSALLSVVAVGGVGWLLWRQSRKAEGLVEALATANRKATAATTAKSAFLANKSHELRTPLNAIVGFADALRGGHFGLLSARQAEYIEDIHQAGQHLTALVGGVLDMSKIEAGRLELEETEVSLSAVIETCLQLVLPQARSANVRLSAAPCDPDIRLVADELRLREAVLNLLSNAIKFTLPQGAVSLSTSQRNGSLEIAVSNTGFGMSAAELVTALTPFGQVRGNVQHRAQAGTGLGLPITEALVRLHGGTLSIDSVKGHGTTARILLPASRLLLPGSGGLPAANRPERSSQSVAIGASRTRSSSRDDTQPAGSRPAASLGG
ncbi:MAG: hypothetical protein FJX68_02825 [Alphaproteobacteria bacterium]|nr:hypothetical protein [Alphaproteobacteria bacterium]